MPINPNNQDPRSTGGGDYTGVHGAGFGGQGLQAGVSKAREDARADDKIAADVDAMSASGTNAEGTADATPALDTDDGQAGRLDELE